MSMRYTPTDITSTYAAIAALNANFDDIAALLEKCVFVDGTAPNQMEADLDVNHFKIQNVGAPVNPTDAVRLVDVQDLTPNILNGTLKTITTTSAAQAAKVGENIQATNSTNTGMYSLRFGFMNKTGNLSDGSNDVSDTLISRWDNITNGSTWGRWDVVSSPLNPSSGLPGAPTLTQRFACVLGEGNPQNRHSDPTWEPDSRGFPDGNVVGYQMVPETQDFSGLLGTGVRRGYKIHFGFGISPSAYTNDDQQRHAKFWNGFFGNPNSIAATGNFIFATGYKPFITAVAVVAGGSGYHVGDILTITSGTSQATNSDSTIRVKTVNGSGAILTAEVYSAGYFTDTFAGTVGVTGGSGTGATFSYTLSTNTSERPRAFAAMGGEWIYGIDTVGNNGTNVTTGSATFGAAFARIPNNQIGLVARNAAGNADLTFGPKLNASNEFEISQVGVLSRLKGNLTVMPDASITPAFNGEMTFELTNNTTLKIKVKGLDGTVRSTTLTLA